MLGARASSLGSKELLPGGSGGGGGAGPLREVTSWTSFLLLKNPNLSQGKGEGQKRQRKPRSGVEAQSLNKQRSLQPLGNTEASQSGEVTGNK